MNVRITNGNMPGRTTLVSGVLRILGGCEPHRLTLVVGRGDTVIDWPIGRGGIEIALDDEGGCID